MDIKKELYNKYISTGQAGAHSEVLDAGINPFKGQAPYVEKIIKKYLPKDKQAHILDLGCGHGTYLYFFKKWGYTNLKGIDMSSEQVDLAHRLQIKEVQLGDINEWLQKSQEPADLVLLMDIIEHLPLSLIYETVNQIYRLLRPGGTLLIHVPNAEGLFGMRIRYGDLTHERAFTQSSIRQLLSSIGFSSLRCTEEKPLMYSVKSVLRRIVWELGIWPFRLLFIAETGRKSIILSQNMLVIAKK